MERTGSGGRASRFLTLNEVAEELNTSRSQVYALVRTSELRALKIGGRGVWRVSRDDLEAHIERGFAETARWVKEHPFSEGDEAQDD